MKKLFSVLAVIAAVLLASAFISCSNPSTPSNPSNSGGNSGGGSNPSTPGGNSGGGGISGNSTVVDENDPFAGTTWVNDLSNEYLTYKTTIKFFTNGTVDYSMDIQGSVTSLYSGPYTVKKDFAGVSGQYGAIIGSQTFTIPNKDATTTTFGNLTFKKQ